MPKMRLRHAFVAVLLLVAMLAQGTWALAGTTGNITGTVTDSTNGRAIAGATVTASSPSQSATTTTDAAGHFTFLSLTPDTYSVTATKSGYNSVSLAGIAVFADQTQTVALSAVPELRTIARVTSRAGALVKPGTTSDVYSVNATTAAKVTGIGGGGSLDQAYSAIATMPGAYVPVGQAGWYQTVYIRGGDYDQVGYEVDGVPVNRAFDNYPANTASALGQNEVQVYTGASPATAEGQGLAGYINQVIKTGTYPGFGNADLGVGDPIFYHKANIEAGGASPNRMFSYYAGFGGTNQNFRTLNNNEGSEYTNTFGTPYAFPCPATAPTYYTLPGCYNSAGVYQPGWYVMGPFNYNALNMIFDRENVVNFHFGIPHHSDQGRDDVQLLWQASSLKTYPHLAPSDWGPLAFYCASAGVPQSDCNFNTLQNSPLYGPGSGILPVYPTSTVYTGPVGALIPAATATAASFGATAPYGFPSAPQSLTNPFIPFNQSDSVDNSIGLVKLQYQRNFSSNAYLRLYGYTSFSDWFNWGPNSANDFYTGSIPTDYELSTHTRGVSATFADQINSQNLLQIQGSYTTAFSLRMNNLTMFNGGGTTMAVLVDSLNPYSGICYTAAGTPAYCDRRFAPAAQRSARITVDGLASGTIPAVTGTCNGDPCAWLTVDNGLNGRYNTVTPKFTSGSITDEFEPNAKLHLNLGLRYDRYEYDPSKTDVGTRPFWTTAWNAQYCYSSATSFVVRPIVGNGFGPCPAGTSPALVTDVSNTQAYTVVQPRIGATYTLNPLNVLRFSYGKYDQAPNAAFEQYDALQQNLPDVNRNFYTLGFTAPTHHITPMISFNTDLSWEHQVKGTDLSWKITPFYRVTRDQIQQFYLDIKTAFVSGLNVGQQTSKGVEFQLQKGDFSRNGLSGILSYTYTDAYIKYQAAPNGKTPITDIDTAIAGYNAYTSACAPGGSAATATQFGSPVCGTTATGVVAAPCYTAAGAPISSTAGCVAGTIANPYWNSPLQSLYDPFGTYAPYDLFPAAAPGAGNYGSYVTPHVATLVLNWKKDKFAITPALQFSAGNKFGYPISTLGVAPETCTATLTSGVSSDPRYPYGGFGGAYDASTCGGTYSVAIPNPQTGKFDAVGGLTSPSRITLATQISYEISPNLTAVATLANIVDRCFGGSSGVFNNTFGIKQNQICGYGGGYAGVGINPIGNNYNPPLSSVQPFLQNSYYPGIGTLPFNAYFDLRIKL